MKKEPTDKKATEELIDKFEELVEKYIGDNIDVAMLKKGVIDVIDNWSD